MTYLVVIGESITAPGGYCAIRCEVGSLFIASGVAHARPEDGCVIVGTEQSVDKAQVAENTTLIMWDPAGHVRVQAGVTGLRPVYYASATNSIYVSDDPALLARIIDAPINIAEVAVRLSTGASSYPLNQGTMWQGVTMVRPGSWLSIYQGALTIHPWWRCPNEELELKEAASHIRQSLTTTTANLLRKNEEMVVGISGDLESITTGYTLAEQHRGFRVVTVVDEATQESDVTRARRAVADMDCEHHLLNMSGVSFAQEKDGWRSFPEGPSDADTFLPLMRRLETFIAKGRPTIYLNGIGGSAVFGAVSSLPWSLMRTSRLRDFLSAWQLTQKKTEFFAMMRNCDNLAQELRDNAKSELVGVETQEPVRWIPYVALPTFATQTAADALRGELLRHSESADLALSEDLSQHQMYAAVLQDAAMLRRMNLMMRSQGILEVHSLFLDRSIIESGLALRPRDRLSRLVAKPLLAASRPRMMPMQFFRNEPARRPSLVAAQSAELSRAFAQGSVLADLGLVDMGKLRAVLNRSAPSAALMRTYRMEMWLRAYERGKASARQTCLLRADPPTVAK